MKNDIIKFDFHQVVKDVREALKDIKPNIPVYLNHLPIRDIEDIISELTGIEFIIDYCGCDMDWGSEMIKIDNIEYTISGCGASGTCTINIK